MAPDKFVRALLDRDLNTAREVFADGIDVNHRYPDASWTALHYLAENGVVESAQWLLENGANPNEKDLFGQTPLHLAIDSEATYQDLWSVVSVSMCEERRHNWVDLARRNKNGVIGGDN